MPVQARMVVAGMSATEAAASVGSVANNLTATGGSQAAALPLPADVNRVTSGAGAGVILAAMNPGDNIVVFNATGGALNLYPPLGGQINALAVNTAYSIANATPYCCVTCVTPGLYHCMQSA